MIVEGYTSTLSMLYKVNVDCMDIFGPKRIILVCGLVHYFAALIRSVRRVNSKIIIKFVSSVFEISEIYILPTNATSASYDVARTYDMNRFVCVSSVS